jgi:hypothetical protein
MKTVAIQTGASVFLDPSTLPILLLWQGFRQQGGLALQLLFLKASESMGNHDSEVVGACSVD